MKTPKDLFFTYLLDSDIFTKVCLWNEYCADEDNYAASDTIYEDVESLVETCGFSGVETARRIVNGDVSSLYAFAYLNGYENICTFTDWRRSPIDISALADWIEETNHQEWVGFVKVLEEAEDADTTDTEQ